MANNIIYTAGTGSTILAQEVTDPILGTGKQQMIGLMDATSSSSVKMGTDLSVPIYGTLPSTATATPTVGAGRFASYHLINLNASPVYLMIYDTTGAVTLGTTMPKCVIPIPSNATPANGSAVVMEHWNGAYISAGMKYIFVTAANGSTPVTSGVSGTIWYSVG